MRQFSFLGELSFHVNNYWFIVIVKYFLYHASTVLKCPYPSGCLSLLHVHLCFSASLDLYYCIFILYFFTAML